MKIINYFKDTKAELSHIKWPTRSEIVHFTIIVVVVTLAVAAFLGLFDYIFKTLLDIFVF